MKDAAETNYSTEVIIPKLLRVMPTFFKQVKGVPPHKRGKVLLPMINQIVASTAKEDPQFRITDVPWQDLTKILLERYQETCSPEEFIMIRAFLEQRN